MVRGGVFLLLYTAYFAFSIPCMAAEGQGAAANSILTLPEMEADGVFESDGKHANPRPLKTKVKLGQGSTPDPAENSHGVSLVNAEGVTRVQEDSELVHSPSLLRASPEENKKKVWIETQHLIATENTAFSRPAVFRLGTSLSPWKVEGLRDRSSYRYVDDKNTPYSSQDDEKASLPLFEDHLGVHYLTPELDASVQWKRNAKRAGVSFVGSETHFGFTFSQKWEKENFKIIPYLSGGVDRFTVSENSSAARYAGVHSQVAKDGKLGSIFEKNISVSEKFSFQPRAQLQSEWLWRQEAQRESSRTKKFLRQTGDFGSGFDFTFSDPLATHTQLSLGLVKDQNTPFNSAPSAQQTVILFPKKKWRMRADGSYQIQSATPKQRWGDGVLIGENPTLLKEKKGRASVGPEWKSSGRRWNTSYFREQTNQTPVLVGTSPASAKYFSLGGIWAQGLFTEFTWGMPEENALAKRDVFSGSVSVEWQEALLNSEVSWQKGNPAPGRPKLKTEVELVYSPSAWSFWSKVSRVSGVYRDLGGSLKEDPRVLLDLGVELALRKNEFGPQSKIRVKGSDLLAETAAAENVRVAGAAGETILEPELPEQKIALEWEWSW